MIARCEPKLIATGKVILWARTLRTIAATIELSLLKGGWVEQLEASRANACVTTVRARTSSTGPDRSRTRTNERASWRAKLGDRRANHPKEV